MNWRKSLKRVNIQASLICVFLVIGSSLTIFYVNYNITYNNIIETLQMRTDAIYNSLYSIFDVSLFDKINVKDDMDTQLYKDYQQKLLEMRLVSNVRYLYTAKRNNQNEYIYLIDGLPLGSNDFRVPGALIEEDIYDDIDSVYKGQVVRPDEILDTTWGKIFLAYYPIYSGEGHRGDIVGVIGIEIDAETQYNTYHDMMKTTPLIIFGACVIAFFIFTWCFRYISNPRRRDIYNIDTLTGLKNRASLDSDFKNVYSKEQYLSLIMVDLDHLKKMNDEFGHDQGDEYIRLTGQTIDDVFGEIGVAYRFGGDEFVIKLDTTNDEKIQNYIMKLNSVFQKNVVDLKGDTGLSVGYAVYNQVLDENLYATLKRADIMMYKNKRKKY